MNLPNPSLGKFSFGEFFRSEAASGKILIGCIVAALLWSNVAPEPYFNLLGSKIGGQLGPFDLRLSILHWINDGLMSLFFLLVGLEIKREVLDGELSTLKKSSLPIFAAIGGMLLPALLYAFVCASHPNARSGWAIPMATDIAFALGILSLVGSRVPVGLRILLAAFAIVDDIGAVLVIAIFFSHGLNVAMLLGAAAVLGVLIVLSRRSVGALWIYLVLGLALWLLMQASGIHATIAGILLAMTIPAGNGLLSTLEHRLQSFVTFVVMPVFAIANAGVLLSSQSTTQLLGPVPLGVFLGLVIGKPVGVSLAIWLSLKLKAAELPIDCRAVHVLGIGFLAGIGFTMSLFLTELSLGDAELVSLAKIAILAASTVAGSVGYAILASSAKNGNLAQPD